MKIYKNCLKNAFLLLSFFFLACEEPYTPEVLEGQNSFLVVSGFLNSNGPTTITLSRTQNLSDANPPKMEVNGSVVVEEENGARFTLAETSPGTYSNPRLPLISSKRYRLVIKASGKEYASDFVQVKQTPVIDSLTWRTENDGLQIYVNSHDPQNNTLYYRWEFEETWEYTAYYYSGLEFINGQLQNRSFDNNIYLCWRQNQSTDLHLGSTVKLGEDIVSNYPLVKIPSTSDKLDRKYSILVKQYALTKEAFDFYEALKKNTESIGTLFDPLPTQLTGNIHCLTSPSEPVIGFITISSVTTKRIFVSYTDLPLQWGPPRRICDLDTIPVEEAVNAFTGTSYIPISRIFSPTNTLIGYSMTSRVCGDCTVYGTNVRPQFWR